MSTQLGVKAPSATSRSLISRQNAGKHVSFRARTTRRTTSIGATEKKTDAPASGTGFLKGGLPFGGTLSLKLNKEGGTQLGGFTLGKTMNSRADPNTIFVAGATGRSGARIVRELLQAGFKVRAGARSIESAQQAVDVAEAYGLLTGEMKARLQIVECDITKPGTLAAAIGSAKKVVCAVGAPETEAFNAGNPKKIDGDGTIALINKCAELGVEQFVLISSLGTGKVGFPASVLNLFWGVLLWKREAEKALEASGMAYTIVRPGGMERPTDSYKKTHNLVVNRRDTTFGGQVSRLQVAELVTSLFKTPDLAMNKVLEVTAETTAPQRTFQELLAEVPADINREEQLAAKEAADVLRAEVAAAQERVAAAKATLEKADARVKELVERLKSAKAEEAEVKAKVAPILKDGQGAEKALEAARKAAEEAARIEVASKAVLEAARKAASQGQLLDKKQLKAVADQVLNPPPPPPPKPQPTKPQLVVAAAAASAGTGTTSAAPAAPAPKPLFGWFGAAQAPVQAEEAAKPAPAPAAAKQAPAAAKAAPKQAPAAAPKQAPAAAQPAPAAGGFFASLLGGTQSIQVDADAKAPKVPAPAAAKVAPAAAKQASPAPIRAAPVVTPRAAPAAAPEPAKPAPVAKPAPAAEAPAKAAAPAPAPAAKPAAPAKEEKAEDSGPAGFFANLFGMNKAVVLDEVQLKVEPKEPAKPAPPPPAAAAPAPAPTPAPAAPVAEAKPAAPAPAAAPAKPAAAAPAAPAAAAPAPAPAAPASAPAAPAPPPPPPAKPKAPVESPADIERRTLEALAAERRQKALEAAKTKLAAEAAALEAAKAKLAAQASQVAPSPPQPAAQAKPVAAAEAKPAAAEAPKAKKSGDYDSEAAAVAKKEAQEWIAAWKAQQKSAEAKSS